MNPLNVNLCVQFHFYRSLLADKPASTIDTHVLVAVDRVVMALGESPSSNRGFAFIHENREQMYDLLKRAISWPLQDLKPSYQPARVLSAYTASSVAGLVAWHTVHCHNYRPNPDRIDFEWQIRLIIPTRS